MNQLPDPALHTAVLAALESATNRALSLSTGGLEGLATLEDEVFAFHCTAPELDFYLHPGADGIRLTGIHEGPVTTHVTGAASDFAELAHSDDAAATLVNGDLRMEGNSAPLLELQKQLSTLDIDWEAPLVDTLGDVAGHELAQLLRQVFSWGKQASSSLTRQLREFIQEEARLSPPRLEVEDFYQDVHELGLRVERLQSRSERLRRKIQELRGEAS